MIRGSVWLPQQKQVPGPRAPEGPEQMATPASTSAFTQAPPAPRTLCQDCWARQPGTGLQALIDHVLSHLLSPRPIEVGAALPRVCAEEHGGSAREPKVTAGSDSNPLVSLLSLSGVHRGVCHTCASWGYTLPSVCWCWSQRMLDEMGRGRGGKHSVVSQIFAE